MEYFNPTDNRVDEIEAERAARMVDWCVRDQSFRDLLVDFGVRRIRAKLANDTTHLPLDGLVDRVCLVILDIRHQGRGGYTAIRTALRQPDPFEALLSIRAAQYRERIATLRAGIRDLEAAGRVGLKVYDAASQDFVVPEGA